MSKPNDTTTIRISKDDHSLIKVLAFHTGLTLRVSLALAIELYLEQYPELKHLILKSEGDGGKE